MLNGKFKYIIVNVISYLYIFLFVYAAVSKLIDFENFQVQLGQSPILSAFAGYLVWIIPFFEILIALFLSITSFRKIGLILGYGLMVMFTVYIYLILNHSSFIPCSCGGVLEKMSWGEHLYFNIIFSVLALVGLMFLCEKKIYTYIKLVSVSILSVLLIVVLFLSSEEIVYKRNNFIRRFPPFPAKRDQIKELNANSYYFAGKSDSELYLGNTTAPALISAFDFSLDSSIVHRFKISDTLFNFMNIKLKVVPPYFYVIDGKVPCIFQGKLEDLKATLKTRSVPGFTKAIVIDSSTLIVRTLNKTRENLLASLNIDNGSLHFAPNLLEKQKDGLFDTDGTLQYSPALERFVYLYYYRNEYIIADKQLHLIDRGNTIDTTTQAAIKVDYVSSKNERKFSAPPLLVNRMSTLHNNLLFVNSTLPSRYEERRMWKNANVIDVYDIITKSYLMSFYVYKVDGDKIDDMMATDTHLYVLIGSKLISYRFSPELVDKMYQK